MISLGGISLSPITVTATCHHQVPELMELARKFVEDSVNKDPYLFYLWGHSYEFEANSNWNVIEDFSKYIGNRDDIWYATNIEIYEYVKAYEQLIYSVNGKRISNPTSTTIWLSLKENTVQIKAGETITVT